jgi:hypothetical protein
MWAENQIHSTNKNNNKIELSLSAIMFFSPLIQNIIKKDNKIINQDKTFIKSFIKLGYFNIFLLVITIWLQIWFYLTNLPAFDIASLIFISILTISLVIWSIYAISDTTIPLLNNGLQKIEETKKSNNINNKFNYLINYIPFYNIYLRYKNHNFDTPDLILKESISRWSLFAIIFILFQNQTINRIFISILWIRIISLMNNIDVWKTTKQKLNKLFTKNPEELRWYIGWFITHIFSRSKISLQDHINIKKEKYQLLFKLNNKQIALEYIILSSLSIFSIYQWYTLDNYPLIIATLFIVTRYIIMIVKRNHLPHLPILREITNIFFKSK